jgi:hypothetical protein
MSTPLTEPSKGWDTFWDNFDPATSDISEKNHGMLFRSVA